MLSGLSCACLPVVWNPCSEVEVKSRKRSYGHPTPRPGAPLLVGVEGTLHEGGATAMKFNYDNNLRPPSPIPERPGSGCQPESNCSCSGCVFKTVSLNTRGGDSQVGNSCFEHCLSTLEEKPACRLRYSRVSCPKTLTPTITTGRHSFAPFQLLAAAIKWAPVSFQ